MLPSAARVNCNTVSHAQIAAAAISHRYLQGVPLCFMCLSPESHQPCPPDSGPRTSQTVAMKHIAGCMHPNTDKAAVYIAQETSFRTAVRPTASTNNRLPHLPPLLMLITPPSDLERPERVGCDPPKKPIACISYPRRRVQSSILVVIQRPDWTLKTKLLV